MRNEIGKWKKQMNRSSVKCSRLICIVLALVSFATVLRASDDSEVRGTVQRVFQQLKSRDYGSLYEVLPAASRARMTRERFISALQRAQNVYSLDRMDVGAVRVAGDIAVVDTVLYEVSGWTVAAIVGGLIAVIALVVLFVRWLRKEK